MSLLNAITSPKGAVLLVPAILLVGGTLFIGQQAAPAGPQAQAESKPAATAPAPSSAAAAPAQSQPAAPALAEKPASGSAFTAAQRKELDSIIKEFLLNNPDVLFDAQAVLDAKMDKIQTERMAVAMKEFAGELYRPAGSPIVGNVKGDVPIVEFFDYNCGYCKK